MLVRYFKTPQDFRRWLARNHSDAGELWVGFLKKATGKPSITWPESVDEALCFGWIDGLRKSIDEERYKIRFTPRRPNSHWSAVNVRRMQELIESGLMQQPGLDAFAKRTVKKTANASHEQRHAVLDERLESRFQSAKKAWADFQNRSPSYRKQCIWWIMSAVKDETREKRMMTLIKHSRPGEVIPELRWAHRKK